MRKRFIFSLIFLASSIAFYLFSPVHSEEIKSESLLYDVEQCPACTLTKLEPVKMHNALEYYSNFQDEDNYTLAEKKYIYGRLSSDKYTVCESIKYYILAAEEKTNPELIYEYLFLLSEECGLDRNYYYEKIKNISGYKAKIYSGIHFNNLSYDFEEMNIEKEIKVEKDKVAILFGNSTININENSLIGSQVDRVERDWYSTILDKYPPDFEASDILHYHEGKILSDIYKNVNVSIYPVYATIAIKRGDVWYAPDEKGVFKFEIGEDKIEYPTSKCYKNICLITDTHGISALVQQSVELGASLVIGCGDNIGKMNAAYYLANKGIDVYFPADRFVGEVLGYKGKGILIGTAPVRNNTIGNQRIIVFMNESIIVEKVLIIQNASHYYDAPSRYFKELEKYLSLKTIYVDFNQEDKTEKLIRVARDSESRVIALRIMTEEDYDSLKGWLSEDKNNRAILFHSALYFPGQKLFEEFSEQTSFGDPRPIFINDTEVNEFKNK